MNWNKRYAGVPFWGWALGVGTLIGAGTYYWLTRLAEGAGAKDFPPLLSEANMSGGKVHHIERAAGCTQAIRDFLAWWNVYGPFHVTIDRTGGLRASATEQLLLAATGKSEAASLEDTPHGRGAAIDLYPVRELYRSGGVKSIWTGDEGTAEERAQAEAAFELLATTGESRGLKAGRRFRTRKFPNGDSPHLEVPNWRSLPYPPAYANV